MMKLKTFQSGQLKNNQDSVVWGSLLLFVVGIAILLLIMKLMPYSVWIVTS